MAKETEKTLGTEMPTTNVDGENGVPATVSKEEYDRLMSEYQKLSKAFSKLLKEFNDLHINMLFQDA